MRTQVAGAYPDLNTLRGELRTIWVQASKPVELTYWTGLSWQLGTAAYWEELAHEIDPPTNFRLGDTLAEEVGACLIGGHGVPFELALAAYRLLQSQGVFRADGQVRANDVEDLLRQPLTVRGRPRRYRFPKQRASRVADAMAWLATHPTPSQARELRDSLTLVPGIGLKTASWIVRNHLASSEVAVIDIHVIRAGTVAGVFAPEWNVTRHYLLYEQAFLSWATQGHVDAAWLDACIWGLLAHAGPDGRHILGLERLSATPQPVWPVGEVNWTSSPPGALGDDTIAGQYLSGRAIS